MTNNYDRASVLVHDAGEPTSHMHLKVERRRGDSTYATTIQLAPPAALRLADELLTWADKSLRGEISRQIVERFRSCPRCHNVVQRDHGGWLHDHTVDGTLESAMCAGSGEAAS